MERGSGVLLHISSLEGGCIGGLGKAAYDFADRLREAGFGYWQILPLNPTSLYSGNSPYSSESLFAGNTYFLDWSEFVRAGWLDESDLYRRETEFTDYSLADGYSKKLLAKAFANADGQTVGKARAWAEDKPNLRVYALYAAIKDVFRSAWYEWPAEYRDFHGSGTAEFSEKHRKEIDAYIFGQYFFFRQFEKLKNYANGIGIKIIGDFPVYANFDSADVWANTPLFEVSGGKVVLGAGVPPDYFSATGQLWGNPVYNVAEHKKSGYSWMLDRFRTAADLCDVLRVDHFRGYESFWAVPYGETTAAHGSWRAGFGKELFGLLKKDRGAEIIAEDLGVITDGVRRLRDELGFPGMNVLQFAFGEDNSGYLPENNAKNSVTYIGTHDNDTLVGWLKKAGQAEKERILRHVGSDDYKAFFPYLFSSESDVVIISMQDMLGLDSRYRMNVPSKPDGNWVYKMRKGQFDDGLVKTFAGLNRDFGR